MPNIKSMIKDVKKSRERHARNVAAKSKIKTFTKKAKAAIQTGEVETIQKAIVEATS
ncbi:MAG: 30S ribosomal protein S20, partial [Armatimonadetes bacterium]|nr:30S ribosomal protein S20 [Armatimonadota bacterium]